MSYKRCLVVFSNPNFCVSWSTKYTHIPGHREWKNSEQFNCYCCFHICLNIHHVLSHILLKYSRVFLEWPYIVEKYLILQPDVLSDLKDMKNMLGNFSNNEFKANGAHRSETDFLSNRRHEGMDYNREEFRSTLNSNGSENRKIIFSKHLSSSKLSRKLKEMETSLNTLIS